MAPSVTNRAVSKKACPAWTSLIRLVASWGAVSKACLVWSCRLLIDSTHTSSRKNSTNYRTRLLVTIQPSQLLVTKNLSASYSEPTHGPSHNRLKHVFMFCSQRPANISFSYCSIPGTLAVIVRPGDHPASTVATPLFIVKRVSAVSPPPRPPLGGDSHVGQECCSTPVDHTASIVATPLFIVYRALALASHSFVPENVSTILRFHHTHPQAGPRGDYTASTVATPVFSV